MLPENIPFTLFNIPEKDEIIPAKQRTGPIGIIKKLYLSIKKEKAIRQTLFTSSKNQSERLYSFLGDSYL